MTTASKYTFDVEFRPEGDLVSNAARARQKKAYSHDEIDQLCARAREQGMKAGQVRAQEAIAAGARDAAAVLQDVLARTSKEVEQVRADAVNIALVAAKKLAKAALSALPQAEIEVALREAMHQALGEPRILLRTAQGVAEALSARLGEIAHDEGFDGRVQIVGDPALKGTDCRIEWRGGGAERSELNIENALQELIARHFAENAHAHATEE
ncbi:MAG TPA: FliH/SctL family protein [Rhizomicrobium sp.]|jgi:flagellar assembly protein FliH|nr:FliH/SctL family protein [Rhizomicrobium sp.]